jgi:polysaccharide pyruvyl transferase CsaB
MRILISGSFGMGNLGDEAILQGMIEAFRAEEPDIQAQVVAGNVQHIRTKFQIDGIRWDSWADIMVAAQKADLLLQGGGGLFFDYGEYHPEKLLQNGAPDLNHFGSFPLVAGMLGKRFMIFGCGVGPLQTGAGEEIVRLAFSTAQRATVRDRESLELLTRIGAPVDEVKVTADPAFMLRLEREDRSREILDACHIQPDQPFMVVALRQWNMLGPRSDWPGRLAEVIEDFAREEALEVLLLPLHKGYDNTMHDVLAARMHSVRPRIVSTDLSPEDAIGLIGKARLLIGMRLHSIVFAVMTGTPVVGLEYAPKVGSLMRRIGCEEFCLTLPDLTRLDQVVRRAWIEAELIREKVSKKRQDLTIAAKDNVAIALDFLAEPTSATEEASLFRRTVSQAMLGRLKEIRAYEYTMRNIIDGMS